MIRFLCCLLIPFLVGAGARAEPLRGITISCQTYGPEWATPEMEATLDDIRTLGANAFAVHPYAKISEDGSIGVPSDSAPDSIVKPARWAHQKNLTMMLTPHLAYWGTKFSWRGEIDFSEPTQWQRFFFDYTRWMTGLAATCEREKVPIICIGLEYSLAVRHEAEWREMICQIRAIYHGQLTYGANWDTYRDVPFWDALDFVGILAYFPLTTSKQPNPSDETLRLAWKKWLSELSDYSQKMHKPILFTELSYNEASDAPMHPWDYKVGGPNAAEMQARCLRIALEETGRADFLRGVFLWKWLPTFPNQHPENFDLRKPAPRSAIQLVWGKDG